MIYTQLTEINNMLFYFINHNLQNSFFDFLMPEITDIGSVVGVSAICLILLIYSIARNNKKLKNLAIMGFIAILIAGVTIFILKVLVAEPRPFMTLEFARLLIYENDPFSFPSGHTGNIFAIATVFGLNWKIHIKGKAYRLIWILIPIACLIGFSRIYIGVHYPWDVFIGAIIGIISGLIAIKIGKSYLKRYNKSNEKLL